jgi:serine/threonine-protein phosphatase 5
VLASDVLWSDPVMESGLRMNESRQVGLSFGPDVTEQFLRENGLRLLIRSHEGPDARHDRKDMSAMLTGYTLDHVTSAGALVALLPSW